MSLSRRGFLSRIAAVSFVPPVASRNEGTQASEPYSDPLAASVWITEAFGKLGSSTGALRLGRFADPMYFLLSEIEWSPEPGQNVGGVKVPVGFVTDFASIPRVFWTVMPKDAEYTFAAIVHDYLYWIQDRSRSDADSTLKFVMDEFKVSALTKQAVLRGVQLGGGGAWASNAARKIAGERRLLKRFPSDPKTRWKDWKTSDVFSD